MKKLLNILARGVLFGILLFLVPVTSFATSITFTNLTDGGSSTRTLTSFTAPAGYTSAFSFAPFTAVGFTITAATGGLVSNPSLLISDVALTDLMTASALKITPTASGNGDILQIQYAHTFANGSNGNKLYSARGAGNMVGANATGQAFSLATIGCFVSACGVTPNNSLPTLNLPIDSANNFSASLANQTRTCTFGSSCTQTLRQTLTYDFETNEAINAPGSFSTLGAYDGDGGGAARMVGLNNFLHANEVPEPTTILLLGGGLLFLGWVGRKRLLAQ